MYGFPASVIFQSHQLVLQFDYIVPRAHLLTQHLISWLTGAGIRQKRNRVMLRGDIRETLVESALEMFENKSSMKSKG
jgi:hypothetical protein